MGKIIAILTLIMTVAGGFFVWQKNQVEPVSKEVSWEECTKDPTARIMESYPARCATDDGKFATQPLSEDEREKLQPPVDQDKIVDPKGEGILSCQSDSDCQYYSCKGCFSSEPPKDFRSSSPSCLGNNPNYLNGCKCVNSSCQFYEKDYSSNSASVYSCPPGNVLNCKPITPYKDWCADREYFDWAHKNCPNFSATK